MSTPLNIKQEFSENGYHRLVHDDGRSTTWTAYRNFVYMDGWVGYTSYWAATDGICTADEFCKMAGVH